MTAERKLRSYRVAYVVIAGCGWVYAIPLPYREELVRILGGVATHPPAVIARSG